MNVTTLLPAFLRMPQRISEPFSGPTTRRCLIVAWSRALETLLLALATADNTTAGLLTRAGSCQSLDNVARIATILYDAKSPADVFAVRGHALRRPPEEEDTTPSGGQREEPSLVLAPNGISRSPSKPYAAIAP